MLLQLLICMIATISFAILFTAPKSELIFCGLAGTLGWFFYLICIDQGAGKPVANLVASFALTVFSRVIASMRKNPVTVYLIAGIFPLVPGAGIYNMSFYFIMNEMELCSAAGMETIKVAGAIVLGIIFGFTLPQGWFNTIPKWKKHR